MRFLLVCTGNTCRSPMAQVLLRRRVTEQDEVLSAGLAADGSPASAYAIEAAAEVGLDLSAHRSHTVNAALCSQADAIGVMSPSHKAALTAYFGVPAEKITVLGGGIPDPYGGTLDDYRRTRDALDRALTDWLCALYFHVVPMKKEHLDALAAVEAACFSNPWSKDALYEELTNETASFLVAEDRSGKAVGYLGLHIVADEGMIANVAVSPDCRRQGAATALLRAADKLAHTRALSRLTLEVRPSNTAAVALYEREGFVKDGIRPHFYSHPAEDAAIYSKYYPRPAHAADSAQQDR